MRVSSSKWIWLNTFIIFCWVTHIFFKIMNIRTTKHLKWLSSRGRWNVQFQTTVTVMTLFGMRQTQISQTYSTKWYSANREPFIAFTHVMEVLDSDVVLWPSRVAPLCCVCCMRRIMRWWWRRTPPCRPSVLLWPLSPWWTLYRWSLNWQCCGE